MSESHATTSPTNSLNAHYQDYFATEQELEWYRLAAVDKARNIMELCADVPHESIIDIGLGSGAVLHRLDELGFGSRLYGVDISESGLAAIRQLKWNRLVECKAFDGSTIPYPDQHFDLAVLSHVVEHLEHPRVLLREAMRVARHVYVEVPLEYNLTSPAVRRDFVLDQVGHINFYNPKLIRLLVQSTGLRVLRQEVRHIRRDIYTSISGRRGLLKYYLKESMLRIAPRLATKLFWYHCCLLCTAEPGGVRRSDVYL